MKALAFASFLPPTVLKRPHRTSRTTVPRRPLYACQSQESKPVKSEPLPSEPVNSSPAPLARRDAIPSLFRGPEGVLGIVIAAAALLADFSRSLARLIARPRPQLKSAHDLDESIALLTSALDASKAALADTENRLDESLARASTAEAALLGIGDTRDAMRRARQTTQDAETELRRITRLLLEQRERFEQVADEKTTTVEKREEFDKAIKEREMEVQKLQALVADAHATEQQTESTYKAREEELRSEMEQKQKELEEVRAERLRAEEQAVDLEARAASVAEQAEAAQYALEETKKELERVQHDLGDRQKERELIDSESARAVERSKETIKLRHMISVMEREVNELQAELRSRDQVVNEFAMESDELRSLLAARDAELRDVNTRLESATAAEAEKGGDSKLSEMSLDEIQSNLDAQKMVLSAEITKAELASFELSEDDIDPLDRIKKEMNAEEDLLQAGLRKAESTVRVEEHVGARKEGAVDEVLQTIGDDVEKDKGAVEGGSQENEESERLSTVSEEGSLAEGVEPVVPGGVEVARQAQAKQEEEAKPRKRRGRQSKNSTKAAGSDTAQTKPKRKRGRPRKTEPRETS